MVFGSLGSSANQVLIKIKGDDKDFQGAINRSDKSMDGFAAKAKAAGPMIGAAFAAAAVGFVAMSVKMAAAEEVVNRQTESILKSQGVMWGTVKNEVTDYINELEALTAFGDTDLQMAFNRMSSSGMAYNDVMQSMKMVADIAYTKNMNLVASADLVAKAYNGQASALKRYGIVVQDGITGIEALAAVQVEVNTTMADSADRTDTLEGKLESMKNIADDTAEAFGNELIPQLSYYLDAVIMASGGTEELGKALGDALTFPGDVIRDVGELAAVTSEAYKISKAGLKTENEISDVLNLEFETIVDMTEQEVKLKTETLERLGYEDKANQFRAYYAYTNRQIEISLQNQLVTTADLLSIEEDITREGEKQLTTMRERAAAAQREIEARNAINSISGTDMSGLSSTAGKYTARESYTRQSGGATIFFSGNNSGV